MHLSDAVGEWLGAVRPLLTALENNTALTTLRLNGKFSGAAGEALRAALKTNTTLTTLHFDGELSAAASELSVELALQRALRQ